MNPAGGASPFHNPAAWHYGEDVQKPKGSGIGEQMNGMMDKGMNAVGGFFDKSRFRQMVFAWIVMPVITVVAMRFILGAGFFQHGLGALQNPGTTTIAALPLLGVLVGTTGYLMVTVTIGKKKNLQNLVSRVTRLVAFPLYTAAFFWFSCHMMASQGFAHVHNSIPNSQQTNFLHNINNPAKLQAVGLLNTSWMGILILGTIPMKALAENWVNELQAFSRDMNFKRGHLKSGTLKERRKQLRLEQQVQAEIREKRRELEIQIEQQRNEERFGPPGAIIQMQEIAHDPNADLPDDDRREDAV